MGFHEGLVPAALAPPRLRLSTRLGIFTKEPMGNAMEPTKNRLEDRGFDVTQPEQKCGIYPRKNGIYWDSTGLYKHELIIQILLINK